MSVAVIQRYKEIVAPNLTKLEDFAFVQAKTYPTLSISDILHQPWKTKRVLYVIIHYS